MRLPAKVAAIQLEGDSVRVAVVQTGGKKPVVLERHEGRAEYSDPDKRQDALIVAVRDVMRRVNTKPVGFVLCASSMYAVSRLLTVPFRGRQRIAKTVRFELEPYLAFSVDEVAVDFAIANETDGKTEVLAVGMRKTMLAPQLAMLEDAGIAIDGAVPDVSGLTALWWGAAKRGAGPTGVLHVRPDHCILTVVYRKSLTYIRQITRSVADIERDPGAVAREAQNSLRAFQAQWRGEESVDMLVVTGYAPAPEDRDAFDEGLSVPVHFENLEDAFTVKGPAAAPPSIIPAADEDGESGAARRAPDFGDWADVVGVAVASAGTDFVFDFCRDELAPRHAWQGVRRHLAFSGVIAAMALLGYFVFSVVQYQQNRAEIAAIGDQIWDLYARAKPHAPITLAGRPANDFGGTQTYNQIRASAEYDLLLEAMGSAGDISFGDLSVAQFSRPTLLAYLEEISTYMPGDEVKITDIRIIAARGSTDPRIVISGEVVTMAAFDAAFQRLRENATVFTVDSQPATRMTQEGVTGFTITALL